MNFYFRTNYNPEIGIGHYMRCSRLANFFEKKGHRCLIFVDKINNNFFLKNTKTISLYKSKENYKSELTDSMIFINKIIKLKKGYVIIDDYRIGYSWEKKINNYCKKIISIDDFEKRKHYTDIYINQKTKFLLEEYFDKSIFLKKKPLLLLGPNYSIIDKSINRRKSGEFTIIINFGGSGDIKHYFGILREIEKNKIDKLKFILVIGPLSKNVNLVKKLKEIKNVKILKNQINLNMIYSKAHIFIGSAGTSVYETINNKLLSVIFQVSDNQSNTIKSLEKIGHYFFLENDDLKNKKKVSQLLINLFKNYKLLKNLVFNADFKIDSDGKKRILRAIVSSNSKKNIVFNNFKSTKKSNYHIRKVKFKDINDYLDARNNPLNRKYSFNKNKIKRLDHYNWWFENSRSSYVLEKNNQVILYFYHYPVLLSDREYFISGWFVKNEKCTIQDILYALNWQRKLDIKMWLSAIKKNNEVALKYNKFLGWNRLNKNSELFKQIKKKFAVKGFNFYFRNDYDKKL